MKARTIFWSVVAMLPMMAFAQTDDDMYFVPKKKNKSENVQKQEQQSGQTGTLRSYQRQQSGGVADYHSGALRDVDEYNRRGTGRSITIVTETDTFQVDESQLTMNEDGQYVLSKGYSGVNEEPAYIDDDYSCTSRLSRFHGIVTPIVTIYDPWYYDSWYYDPWYYGSWHYRPWHYGYHGWGGYYGWYDPWYYGYYGWHHPYVSYVGSSRNPRGGGRIGGAGYTYRGGGRTTMNGGRSLYGGGRSTIGGGRSSYSSGRSIQSGRSYGSGRGISTRTSGQGVTSSQGRSTFEGMRGGGINSSSRSTVNGSSRGSSMSSGRSTYNSGGSRSTYSGGGSRTGFGGGSRGGGSFSGGSRGGGSFSGGGSRGGGRR